MFDFLPESLDSNLKTIIYILIIVHLVAFSIWTFLVWRSFGRKSTDTFDSYVRSVIKEENKKN